MIAFKNRFHGYGSLRFVYKNGQAVRSRLMTIKYIKNPHRLHSRIAVVVSKKVIKSAVSRNRIRRRLYESIRPQIAKLNGVFDIVIIVSSSELYDAPFGDITKYIDSSLKKSGLYKTQ